MRVIDPKMNEFSEPCDWRYFAMVTQIVQDTLGDYVVHVGCSPALLDGNVYYGKGPVHAFWNEAAGKRMYTLSEAQGFANYVHDTGQDIHSRVAEVVFADAPGGDFHLVSNSAAVDTGQPLTRTTNTGTGSVVPVESVSCFSAGLKTRAGVVIMPGDEIMVADSPARIAGLDHKAQTLILDRPLRWQKGDPVNYAYAGRGPDAGAFEFSLVEHPDQPDGLVREDGEDTARLCPQTYQRWERAMTGTSAPPQAPQTVQRQIILTP